MTEVDGDVAFESKASKPILIKQLEMPMSDWKDLKANEGDHSDKGSVSPFREKLADAVGGGELSEAILDTTGQYVFRCFTRRSDNQPSLNTQPNSTLENTYGNLHQFGVEFSLEEKRRLHTSPGHMWFEMLHPDLERGIDRSFVAVYKNENGALTRETGIQVDAQKSGSRLGRIFGRVVGRNDSKKPSMRDLLVGVVEIDWKKD